MPDFIDWLVNLYGKFQPERPPLVSGKQKANPFQALLDEGWVKGADGVLRRGGNLGRETPTVRPTATATPTRSPIPTPTIPQWKDKSPLPSSYWPPIQAAVQGSEIDPSVIASLLAQETGGYGYEPRRGTSGERGVSQIIPRYHYKEAGFETPEEYGTKLETDPIFAINESTRIMKSLLKQTGSIEKALAAYNAGAGNIKRGRGYAKEVLGRIK